MPVYVNKDHRAMQQGTHWAEQGDEVEPVGLRRGGLGSAGQQHLDAGLGLGREGLRDDPSQSGRVHHHLRREREMVSDAEEMRRVSEAEEYIHVWAMQLYQRL